MADGDIKELVRDHGNGSVVGLVRYRSPVLEVCRDDDHRVMRSIEASGEISKAVVSSATNRCAIVTGDGVLEVRDLEHGSLVASRPMGDYVGGLAFLGDRVVVVIAPDIWILSLDLDVAMRRAGDLACALDERSVLLANHDELSLLIEDAELRWSTRDVPGVLGATRVPDGGVVVGGLEGLTALEESTGERRWFVAVDRGRVVWAVTMRADRLYVVEHDPQVMNTFFVVRSLTGGVMGEFAPPVGRPTNEVLVSRLFTESGCHVAVRRRQPSGPVEWRTLPW